MKKTLKNTNNVLKVLISVFIALLVSALILIIGAGILVKNDVSIELHKYFWLVLAAVSGIISGAFAGRITNSRGFLWGSLVGLISGIAIILVIYIVNSFSINMFTFFILPIFIIFGAVGGIISTNLKK